MHFYKAPDASIHFLDDPDFAHLLPAGSIEISEAEALAALAKLPGQVKLEKWEEIKAERDRLRFEGGVKVGGNWFLSNQTATTEYNSIINLGAPDATVIRANWRTMDGAEVPMSPGLAKQIIVAGFAQAAAIDDTALAHKSAMEASVDPASYDFSAGWPEVYEEQP